MIYTIGKPLFWLYYRIFFRIKIVNRNNLPKTGGVVLCGNHISVNDPLALSVAAKRRISFLAKKEVYKYRIFGPVLRSLGAIPVDRENPERASLKAAVGVLANGGVLGIFAQGGRKEEIDPNDAKSGVAFFALKSGACIVPVKIESTYKFFSRITITFGSPISMEEHTGKKIKSELLGEITQQVMASVAELGGE